MKKEKRADYTLKNSNIYALTEKTKLSRTTEKKPRECLAMGKGQKKSDSKREAEIRDCPSVVQR